MQLSATSLVTARKTNKFSCIEQNNTEHTQSQIALMNRIYTEAHIKIIAAASGGPNYGLPGISRARRPQRCIRIKDYLTIEIYPYISNELSTLEWSSRA